MVCAHKFVTKILINAQGFHMYPMEVYNITTTNTFITHKWVNAPINVKPYLAWDGQDLTKGFDVKFGPLGGTYELITNLSKVAPRWGIRLHVGSSAGVGLNYNIDRRIRYLYGNQGRLFLYTLSFKVNTSQYLYINRISYSIYEIPQYVALCLATRTIHLNF